MTDTPTMPQQLLLAPPGTQLDVVTAAAIEDTVTIETTTQSTRTHHHAVENQSERSQALAKHSKVLVWEV